ncbi:MAG: hypothetical protein ACI4GZ_05925 [Ruminococcus sp.]
MKGTNIRVIGKSEDTSHILELVDACLEETPTQIGDIAVFVESLHSETLSETKVKYAVIPAEDRDKLPLGIKAINFAVGDSSADVCALNLQHREQSSSFEILHDSFMGRVFFTADCKYSQLQILIAYTVLAFIGVENDKILQRINKLLK